MAAVEGAAMELLIIIVQEEDYEGLAKEFIMHRILATKFTADVDKMLKF